MVVVVNYSMETALLGWVMECTGRAGYDYFKTMLGFMSERLHYN